MTIVRRPSPFGELLSLRSAMDRLFEDSFVRPRPWAGIFEGGLALPLDVTATSDEIRVEASLPGLKPEDVEITVEDGTLTISGQSREEHREGDDSYLLQEIRRGTFSRSVTLPTGLEPDKATATFENGVLTLRIPKAEQVKPHQIRISPTTETPGSRPTDSRVADDTGPTVGREPAGAGA
jgi:HSP20 family protein